MLERAISYRSVITQFLKDEAELPFHFSNDDWKFFHDVCSFLSAFALCTNHAVKEGVPTLSTSLKLHHFLCDWLDEFPSVCRTEAVKEMAEAMKIKLEEYYPRDRGFIYMVSTVLNPSCHLGEFPAEGWATVRGAMTDFWLKNYASRAEPPPATAAPADGMCDLPSFLCCFRLVE